MSELRVRQTAKSLEKMFSGLIDLSDLAEHDPELAHKTSTRQLAAFAVMRSAGCSPEEAAKSVIDASKDGGIDAIYYDPSASEILIVQSKWIKAGSGEPSSRDVGAFADGVEAIIEQNIDRFHNRAQLRISSMAEALSIVGTSIKLVIVSTGKNSVAAPAMERLDRIVKKLNGEDDIDSIASFEIIGLSDVYRNLATGSDSQAIDVEMTVLDWSYLSHPYGAYFGTIDGSQLKELWNTYGKRLVAKNIRYSLGSTEVNDAIKQTASLEPEKFWYYNNGITLIANEAKRAPANSASQKSGVFQFTSASIVNGAQTVSSLATVSDNESLGKVRVPVRVIMLKAATPEFGGAVTKNNNLQNRVEGRDFVAQDPEQIRLQSEMMMEGVDYQFLRGGSTHAPTSTTCELIEVVTALACATGDASLAVQAKTAIGRFFADVRRAPYKTIINPQLSGAHAFNAVVMQRKIDELVDDRRRALEKKSGASFGVLLHGNRVLSAAIFKVYNLVNLDQPITTFRDELDISTLEKYVDGMLRAFVAVIERDFPKNFLAILFKSPASSKTVMDRALGGFSIYLPRSH